MRDAGTRNAIVEFAVVTDVNYIMRPAKNPDCATYNPTQYGSPDTTFPFQKPEGMSQEVYNNFKTYYENWKASTAPAGQGEI